jgi:hypothetical protein
MKEILDSSIESQIVTLLQNGTLSATSIVTGVQKVRPNTPKQSVYLALRKLKKKEVIAISGKLVSLHQVWITKMQDFFRRIESQTAESQKISLLNLQEREYVTYRFNSLLSLDMFWAHAFTLFMGKLSSGDSAFLYNPHQWFLIARKESELSIINEATRREVYWVQLIAGKEALDSSVKKYFNGTYARCHLLGHHVFEKNYYANCFGDFLIEVWLDNRASEEIEKLYLTGKEASVEVVSLLQKIIENEDYSHKMKITKNSAKASRFKNLFKKYFIER